MINKIFFKRNISQRERKITFAVQLAQIKRTKYNYNF